MSSRPGPLTLLAAVARGLRARASLTIGSLVLSAVAIGSGVLGPAYQAAASQSFLVARLNEAPPVSSGVSVEDAPTGDFAGDPALALSAAKDVGERQLRGLFGPATTSLISAPHGVTTVFGLPGNYYGSVNLRAKAGGCQHLRLADGVCPTSPGRVMMLAADAHAIHLELGTRIHFPGHPGGLTVVGFYTVPDDVADFWFDESRFVTGSPTPTPTGIAFKPAPLVTDPSTFQALPRGSWKVDIDRFLTVDSDTTPGDVARAREAVLALPRQLKSAPDGVYRVTKDNALQFVIEEIDQNRDTARRTVTPAIVSLVLVALALLVRLLGAAADQRRNELALGSLRGMNRHQMWAFGLGEPLALLAVAAPLGVLGGYLATVWLARIWLVDGVAVTVGAGSVTAAVLVLGAAVGASVFTVWHALGESLSTQLAGVRRPVRSNRWGLIAKMVLVIAAVLVVVSSLTAKGRSAPKTSDLVLPLLLAAATGLLVTAAAVAAAGWWSRRTSRRRGITGFVASRAVSRRREGTLVILPLTAALAISVFAGGVFGAASAWRASTAATRVGADVSYRSHATLAETVATTHRIDPDGRWLMAAGVVVQGNYGEKLVLDTPRLSRVGAWPSTWTPGVDAAQVARLLEPRGPGVTLRGSTFRLTLDNGVVSGDPQLGISVQVEATGGATRTMFFGPFGHGVSTSSTRVGFCGGGCQVRSLLIGGPATTATTLKGSAALTAFTEDGQDVGPMNDPTMWRPMVSPLAVTTDTTAIDTSAPVLTLSLDTKGESAIGGVTPNDVPEYRPVLMGRAEDTEIRSGSGDRLVAKTDALEGLPVDPVGETGSMPFLGPRGMLIDYTMMTRDQDIPKESTEVYVLARGDTPANVTAALKENGITGRTELAATKHVLDQDAYALSLNLYLVAAVAAVALALAGLAVNMAVQLPERRRDSASLRVVGVRRRQILRAVFVELCAVLGAAGLAGVAAGSAAQYIVVRTVTLGFAGDLRTPRVVATLDASRLFLLVAAVVVVLVGVATCVAALAVQRARASTLRESAR
jgi:putative ABC transport system permease protein